MEEFQGKFQGKEEEEEGPGEDVRWIVRQDVKFQGRVEGGEGPGENLEPEILDG